VTQIGAFAPATSHIGQTSLRSVLAQAHLDQLLAGRTDFNDDLRTRPRADGAVGHQALHGRRSTTSRSRGDATHDGTTGGSGRERRAKTIHAKSSSMAPTSCPTPQRSSRTRLSAPQLGYLQTPLEIGGPEIHDRPPAPARFDQAGL
jgi:hypothetical protein